MLIVCVYICMHSIEIIEYYVKSLANYFQITT
jgi:hypothetical protein